MEPKTRKAMVSEYGDYVAVHLINPFTGLIASTPFYLQKGNPAPLWVYDDDEEVWVKSTATFDGEKVTASDPELGPYVIEPEDLEDPARTRFTSPVRNRASR